MQMPLYHHLELAFGKMRLNFIWNCKKPKRRKRAPGSENGSVMDDRLLLIVVEHASGGLLGCDGVVKYC